MHELGKIRHLTRGGNGRGIGTLKLYLLPSFMDKKTVFV